jgi:hypothetical protein
MGGENVTKRNIKTKSGLQTAKSLTNSEFANEMTHKKMIDDKRWGSPSAIFSFDFSFLAL